MKTLKGQAGAAVVEFALVVSVLMVLLLGLTDFGLIWLQSHYIANAAREGARIAAKVGASSDADPADPDFVQVNNAVKNYLFQLYDPDAGYSGGDFIVTAIEPENLVVGVDPVLKAVKVSVTVQIARFYDPPVWGLLNAGLAFFPEEGAELPDFDSLSMTEEATFPYDDQSTPLP